ncbi:MAG TPA: hypothetical protein VF786_13050 [Terriglobales bacterium]
MKRITVARMPAYFGARGIAVLVLLCGVGSATTVKPLSVEELTTRSTHVVLARAVGSRSAWNAAHTLIYTETRFTAEQNLKGTAPATFSVRQIGGSADGYTQKVSGVRGWQPGEEAVLFLRPSEANDGTYAITGLMQGNFAVKQTNAGKVMVSNGVPDVTAFDSATGRLNHFGGAEMSLQELRRRVDGVRQR